MVYRASGTADSKPVREAASNQVIFAFRNPHFPLQSPDRITRLWPGPSLRAARLKYIDAVQLPLTYKARA
jgi:hypothetical protein